jgi:multisubunit Na+/H+ antiporter MnhF subunit
VDWFKGKESHQFFVCFSKFHFLFPVHQHSHISLFFLVKHVVLEHADMSLMDYRTLTLYEYKCILFQILFALFVAQTEYKFVHNDLHLKVCVFLIITSSQSHNTFKMLILIIFSIVCLVFRISFSKFLLQNTQLFTPSPME